MRPLQLLTLAILATATPCCATSVPFVYDTTTNTFSSNPDPGSAYSHYSPAFGINDSGQIVGEYIDSSGSDHGYLYSSGVFTTVNMPGSSYAVPRGINSNGDMVGVCNCGGPGFFYNGGVFTTLAVPGAIYTVPRGINNSEQIVGNFWNGTSYEGFLDSGGVFTTFAIPGATNSYAEGINDVGEIVGFTWDKQSNTYKGFLDSGGVFTNLAAPGAIDTYAEGINDAGEIVGTTLLNGHYEGFLDSGGVFTTFDAPGAANTYAEGINDAGEIVGYSTPAPTPEPSTLLLATVVGIMLVARRRGIA